MVAGTGAGVWRTREVQRRSHSERWSVAVVATVGLLLWHTFEEDDDSGGPSVRAQLATKVAAAEVVPRRMSITKAHLEKLGFTVGCLGRRASLMGRSRQGHSEASRRRLEQVMKDELRPKVAKERQAEFFDRRLRREGESLQKRKDSKDEEESEKVDTKDSRKEVEGAGAQSSADPVASPTSLLRHRGRPGETRQTCPVCDTEGHPRPMGEPRAQVRPTSPGVKR